MRFGFRYKYNCKFLLKNTTRCCKRVIRISCAKLCFSTLTCCRPAAKPYLDYQHFCGDNWHDGNKNNLRTIEAEIVQKLKNNETRPKFTGSYKKEKRVEFDLQSVSHTPSLISIYPPSGAHQQEPVFPILCLGVNPFPSRFICRTALGGGFALTQFKDPIKTELDRVYFFRHILPWCNTSSTLAIVLK